MFVAICNNRIFCLLKTEIGKQKSLLMNGSDSIIAFMAFVENGVVIIFSFQFSCSFEKKCRYPRFTGNISF